MGRDAQMMTPHHNFYSSPHHAHHHSSLHHVWNSTFSAPKSGYANGFGVEQQNKREASDDENFLQPSPSISTTTTASNEQQLSPAIKQRPVEGMTTTSEVGPQTSETSSSSIYPYFTTAASVADSYSAMTMNGDSFAAKTIKPKVKAKSNAGKIREAYLKGVGLTLTKRNGDGLKKRDTFNS